MKHLAECVERISRQVADELTRTSVGEGAQVLRTIARVGSPLRSRGLKAKGLKEAAMLVVAGHHSDGCSRRELACLEYILDEWHPGPHSTRRSFTKHDKTYACDVADRDKSLIAAFGRSGKNS